MLMRELLEMVFPPIWCARAMASTSHDLDATLGWMLTHDDEIQSDGTPGLGGSTSTPGQDEGLDNSSGKDDDSPSNVEEIDDSPLPFNSLSAVSGQCEIKGNLTCTLGDGGFPSVGCRVFAVKRVKWYYEVSLPTTGYIQLGLVVTAFERGSDFGHGVGDCSPSLLKKDRKIWKILIEKRILMDIDIGY